MQAVESFLYFRRMRNGKKGRQCEVLPNVKWYHYLW